MPERGAREKPAGFQSQLREPTDAEILALGEEIIGSGYAALPGYVNREALAELQAMVHRQVDAARGEYTVLAGTDELANTPLARFGRDPRLLRLLRRLYERLVGGSAPQQNVYQVLRCVSGKTGLPHAFRFHYDSYVITALLPIVIPSEGKAGDLMIKPNHRKIRSSYLVNVADKLLVKLKPSQVLHQRDAMSPEPGFLKPVLEPGSLVLFNGYTALHANQPCDIDKIRGTALFHFGDPHLGAPLRKFFGKAYARAQHEASPN